MSSFGNPLNINLSQPNFILKNSSTFVLLLILNIMLNVNYFIAKASPWIAFLFFWRDSIFLYKHSDKIDLDFIK